MNFISMAFSFLLCILRQHVKISDNIYQQDDDDENNNENNNEDFEDFEEFEDYEYDSDAAEIFDENVLNMLNSMEAKLCYYSRLNPNERNLMVTELWQEIMLHFSEMNLEQTVGLLLFSKSNYIEYVDCDIEGDVGIILRAENVAYLSESSSEIEIREVVTAHTQAEVLLQLQFENALLARDDEEIKEFHNKVRKITSVLGLSDVVSYGVLSKLFSS